MKLNEVMGVAVAKAPANMNSIIVRADHAMPIHEDNARFRAHERQRRWRRRHSKAERQRGGGTGCDTPLAGLGRMVRGGL